MKSKWKYIVFNKEAMLNDLEEEEFAFLERWSRVYGNQADLHVYSKTRVPWTYDMIIALLTIW